MPNEGTGIVPLLPHWHTQHQILFKSQCCASTEPFTLQVCASNPSAMLRDLDQLPSTVLQSPGGLIRLQKNTLIYWQGREQFKMLSSYDTFPVLRFEGIPAFCPFFQMTLRMPDPEFCGISAYFTSCLSSFNDSIIYAFNSCTLTFFVTVSHWELS